MAKEQSLESAAANAFRAAAVSHRATADAFDAFAVTYERVAAALPAEPAEKTAPAAPKNPPAKPAPAKTGEKAVTHADVRNALMKLIDTDGKSRARVDAILTKHCGGVVKVDAILADQLAGVLADTNAAIASGEQSAGIGDL